MSPFPHFTYRKGWKYSILFIVLEIVCGNLKNRQIICSLNSIKFYIADCERSYQKFYIKLFSRMWIFRQILSDQSLLQRAVIDFKFGEEAKVIFLLFSWTLGLTFVFSSPPSSAFAYNVIIKKLFLGDLQKRSRLIVKQRKYVKLIFSNQDWEFYHPKTPAVIKTSILERQSRWRKLLWLISYKPTIHFVLIVLLFFMYSLSIKSSTKRLLPTLPSHLRTSDRVCFGLLFHKVIGYILCIYIAVQCLLIYINILLPVVHLFVQLKAIHRKIIM